MEYKRDIDFELGLKHEREIIRTLKEEIDRYHKMYDIHNGRFVPYEVERYVSNLSGALSAALSLYDANVAYRINEVDYAVNKVVKSFK